MIIMDTGIAISYILIIIITLIGGMYPLVVANAKRLTYFVSFGAGTLLATSFLHMIPESMKLVDSIQLIPKIMLFGFLFLYVVERFVMIHICEEEHCDVHPFGITSFIGLSFHSIMAGITLGAGIEASYSLGLVMLFALIIHKIPESFTLTSIMMHSNYQRKNIIRSLLLYAIMVPAGAIIGTAVFDAKDTGLLGYAIAFSAGMFLHVSVSDLLPEVHKVRDKRNLILASFFAGIVVVYIATLLI